MKFAITLLVLAATLAPTQQQQSVRTSTVGVLVDVTVLDKDGKPVTDLTADDFEVTEDGKPQRIVSSTLMRGGVPARVLTAPAAAADPSPSSSVRKAPATPLAVPTVTAILFDSLSAEARPIAARAAAAFVSTLTTGNEYGGVFLSGTSLATIQPFTNKTAELRAAVEQVANIAPSNLSAEAERKRASVRTQGLDPLTPVTPGAEDARGWTTVADREQRLYSNDPKDSEKYLNRMALQMEESYSRFLNEYEGDSSLSGLRTTIAALAPLPGRKSVLYFTEELPITSRLKPRFEALIGEANRGNITIYPVDAAGLRIHSKEQETGQSVKLAGDQGLGDANRGNGAWTKDLENQEQVLSSRPGSVLGRLANETGGFMLDNTNDLAKGVTRMRIERTTYYLLGYQPTNTAMDGKFRKVTVKVKRGKYTVRARPGYTAASGE